MRAATPSHAAAARVGDNTDIEGALLMAFIDARLLLFYAYVVTRAATPRMLVLSLSRRMPPRHAPVTP